ncbi:serine/threonine-protein kinase [Lentisphaera profundi]|uniref:Serine/threonine-protein kinase n=1 Tax=Lentisphaera profundi TaxID=1658616 RepID=A0ABY7VY20_9BACT|nr:serine/threonine-protein kinase [Lentisphaera profundi]WDE98617.1 serine/threonine-protein kinase [Lentisphaera profundi]
MSDKLKVKRDLVDFFDEALEPHQGELYKQLSTCETRYEFSNDLGEGGMKKIILVQDKLTGRQVAKALLKKNADSQAIERFLREARIHAMLEHPNIVPIHDVGIDENGDAYFTMKVIHGKNLKEILNDIKAGNSFLDLNALLDIFVKICDAISYAHSLDIVHMDLKPENIQISQFGEVLVCDWGLARNLKVKDEVQDEYLKTDELLGSFVTMDGVVRGTPGYMSPEQAEGAISRSGKHSDVYSMGALLYSILTLESPGTGTVEEVLEQTISGDILSSGKIKKSVASALKAICCKAMNLKIEDRYEDVESLKKDMLSYLHGFSTSAETIGFSGQIKLLVKRNKMSFTLISFFSTVLLIAGLIFLWSLKESENQAREAEESARKSEAEAKNHLEKWQKSEGLKQLIAGESMNKVMHLAQDALHTYDFEKGVDLANTALELDENLNQAHAIMGYLQLSLFEFKSALRSFDKSGKVQDHKAVKACGIFIEKFGDRKNLDFEEIIWMAEYYASTEMNQMLNEHTFSPKLDFLSLNQRRVYAKVVLKLQSPKLKVINFEATELICDWENLTDINALYKTGITELDMRHSKIKSNVIAIKGLPLRKLVWPRSNPGEHFITIQKCEDLEELYLPSEFKSTIDLTIVPKSVRVFFY